MRSKRRDRKAKIASKKVLLASVTKEMAQPRMTQSAQVKIKIDKQIKQRDGEPLKSEIPPNALKSGRSPGQRKEGEPCF